ncbi:Sterol uptake control protein, partial [Lachnellula willkommii]
GLECCDFDLFIETSQESKSSASSKSDSPALCPIPQPSLTNPSSNGSSRVLELRLMHHYTSTTCGHMPGSQSAAKNPIWSVDIPQLAFHSDLVLSAVLGISALHLSALDPGDQTVALAAQHYFDRAVSQHRLALGNVEEQDAEAILATAILICHHTWLASNSSTMQEPYVLPLQTYYMARGIRVLFDQMWPSLKGSGYLWYAEQGAGVNDGMPSHFDPFLMDMQQDLDSLSKTFDEPDVSPEAKEVYEKTVMEITSMYYAISNGTEQHYIQSRIATMPIRLPQLFLELVAQKDVRALALLARNLALLKVVDNIWWLHGTGKTQQVAEQAVTGIRNLMPPEWTWTMDWPVQVVSGGAKMYEREIVELGMG